MTLSEMVEEIERGCQEIEDDRRSLSWEYAKHDEYIHPTPAQRHAEREKEAKERMERIKALLSGIESQAVSEYYGMKVGER